MDSGMFSFSLEPGALGPVDASDGAGFDPTGLTEAWNAQPGMDEPGYAGWAGELFQRAGQVHEASHQALGLWTEAADRQAGLASGTADDLTDFAQWQEAAQERLGGLSPVGRHVGGALGEEAVHQAQADQTRFDRLSAIEAARAGTQERLSAASAAWLKLPEGSPYRTGLEAAARTAIDALRQTGAASPDEAGRLDGAFFAGLEEGAAQQLLARDPEGLLRRLAEGGFGRLGEEHRAALGVAADDRLKLDRLREQQEEGRAAARAQAQRVAGEQAAQEQIGSAMGALARGTTPDGAALAQALRLAKGRPEEGELRDWVAAQGHGLQSVPLSKLDETAQQAMGGAAPGVGAKLGQLAGTLRENWRQRPVTTAAELGLVDAMPPLDPSRADSLRQRAQVVQALRAFHGTPDLPLLEPAERASFQRDLASGDAQQQAAILQATTALPPAERAALLGDAAARAPFAAVAGLRASEVPALAEEILGLKAGIAEGKWEWQRPERQGQLHAVIRILTRGRLDLPGFGVPRDDDGDADGDVRTLPYRSPPPGTDPSELIVQRPYTRDPDALPDEALLLGQDTGTDAASDPPQLTGALLRTAAALYASRAHDAGAAGAVDADILTGVLDDLRAPGAPAVERAAVDRAIAAADGWSASTPNGDAASSDEGIAGDSVETRGGDADSAVGDVSNSSGASEVGAPTDGQDESTDGNGAGPDEVHPSRDQALASGNDVGEIAPAESPPDSVLDPQTPAPANLPGGDAYDDSQQPSSLWERVRDGKEGDARNVDFKQIPGDPSDPLQYLPGGGRGLKITGGGGGGSGRGPTGTQGSPVTVGSGAQPPGSKPTPPALVQGQQPQSVYERNKTPSHWSQPTGEFKVHPDKQGKHIPEHPGFVPNRSELTHSDPQALLNRHTGQGQPVGSVPRGQPGFKERVDFGVEIGKWKDSETGRSHSTTMGIIHYSGNDAHIVPVRPKEIPQ